MEEESWRTNNVSLAAFLALNFPVLDTVWEESSYKEGSCYWHFNDSEELADAVSDFIGGLARVDPKSYNDKYAQLKKEIYHAKRQFAV